MRGDCLHWAVRPEGGTLGLKDSFTLKVVPIESQGARAHLAAEVDLCRSEPSRRDERDSIRN
jgi:hypothetical protein